MTYEEWGNTYKPIQNFTDYGFDRHLFETYGEDLEFVQAVQNERCWTLVEGDEGLWIVEGRRFVNRLGYFVTMNSWSETVEVPV